MKNVLIVSYYFPPLNNMAAKRFGTMCKYFEEYGYTTSILTSDPHADSYLNSKLDLCVPESIRKIIRIGRTGLLYIPKSICSQMIIQWLDKNHKQSRTLSEYSLGWYEKVKKELDISKLKNIDIIIGTYPPMENLLVASYLSKKLNCPFIADIRDLIVEYSEDTGNKQRSFVLDSIIEKIILKKASAIVSVTEGFGKILKKKYPKKKIKVVFNGCEEDKNVKVVKNEKKYLYYAGSLYDHRLESFELLIECLQEVVKIKDVRMKIRSVGPEDLDQKMKAMIRDNDMDQYIEILDAAEENIVRQEQAGAYINVVLSSIHEEDRALMTTVPGKVYEVLFEKSPVLAIVPENSDVADILEKTDKGIATVSKEKIIEYILNLGKEYSGNQFVQFFSRKNQAKRYCEFLDVILSEK